MQVKEIQEFRSNFAKIFHEQVFPAIKDLDNERLEEKTRIKKLLKKIYIIAGIILIIHFLYGIIIKHDINIINVNGFTFFVIIIPISIAKALEYSAKKSFELKLKRKIMPILMPAFGNMQWTVAPTIGDYEIKRNKIIKYYEDIGTDDNFIGYYKGTPFKISETELTYQTDNGKNKRTVTTFKGIFILINIPKNFTGHTIVLDKSDKRNSLPKSYKVVNLEDMEFSKQFNVYSTDQIEARYLLTTAFMERFKNIQNTFAGNTISCSFFDKDLLIAIPCNKDLFSLGNLNISITDTKQYNVFLNELISIFEIIEELKLYQNTGL